MQNRCIVIATLAATYGLWCGGCVDPDHSVSDGLSVNVKPLRYTLRVGQELTYRLEFKDSFLVRSPTSLRSMQFGRYGSLIKTIKEEKLSPIHCKPRNTEKQATTLAASNFHRVDG